VLTILSVAYPLAPVREDTAGGAEQVLGMLDRALVRAGHRSIVVACEGSQVAGTLVASGRMEGPLTDGLKRQAQARHRSAIRSALERWPVDLVHYHGQDFHTYIADAPAVVTLHVPRPWYALQEPLAGVRYVCVSQSQKQWWPFDPEVIENGVEFDRPKVSRRSFALWLGRVCPEKGTALAVEAARLADVPMLIAGEVYGYPQHERYFRHEVLPALDARRRFIGAVAAARKRRLLAAARCLVITSQIPETSSLVAMEALACGTPVVAFPAGGLGEIVEHGRTGFLVRDVHEMARRIVQAPLLNLPAQNRFPAQRTFEKYLELYRSVVEKKAAQWTSIP
jgi:glycosyltransferase involved in cell wall biosynthesis